MSSSRRRTPRPCWPNCSRPFRRVFFFSREEQVSFLYMFKITILAVGALKEPFWKSAIAEYEKRLSAFAKTKVVEVAETPFGSATEAPTVLRAEAGKLKNKIPDGAFTIALVKEGRALTTEKFAESLDREGQGGREIVFLIGGPLGL